MFVCFTNLKDYLFLALLGLLRCARAFSCFGEQGTLGVPLGGTRRVGGLLRVAGRLSGPWTAACGALPPMGFSRQEYWSRLPLPSPGNLPNPGIKPWSPAFQADALTSEPPGKPVKVIK